MKRIYKIAGFLVGLVLLTSCDKFLELQPRDKKVVSTIEDYRDILASYMRLLKTPNGSQVPVFGKTFTYPYFDMAAYLGIYTGETTMTLEWSVYYNADKGAYTTEGKKILTWMNSDPYCWNQYYSFLGPLNLVISGVRTAEGHNEDLRNYVLGEALTWRAFAYFKLLQYFSPYKNNPYGIPVYLKPDEDIGNVMPARNTQQEVFTQLFNDCREALGLLQKTPTNNWNCAWREDFLNAMMASMYTWKAMSGAAEPTDWENAEKCATLAMKGRLLANSSDVLREIFDSRNMKVITNDEFYFRILDGSNGQIFNFTKAYYESSLIDGLVNPEYYSLFSDNDIRKSIWFTADGTRSDKYNMLGLGSLWGGTKGGCLMLFRLAEMYLIKAEALVRQGKSAEARQVLETFKQARYAGSVELPAEADTLLEEILNERKREFYMENDMRWLDMKRLGVRMERIISGEKVALEPDDFRYTFPIPLKEMQLNKNMVQNPGWEKVLLD